MIGLRDFGDDKGDVILKYYEEEAKELKELGEIPEHIKINEGEFNLDGEDEFGMDEEEKEGDLPSEGKQMKTAGAAQGRHPPFRFLGNSVRLRL